MSAEAWADRVMDDIRFKEIFESEQLSQPWLTNYRLGSVDVGGMPGTVHTRRVEMDGRHIVVPEILEMLDDKGIGTGKLHFFKDGGDEALNRDYGIPFDSPQEADRFSQWLSNEHRLKLRE